ncbi:MAG: AraC family transcriptional regulator [Bacteroidota bacterium]
MAKSRISNYSYKDALTANRAPLFELSPFPPEQSDAGSRSHRSDCFKIILVVEGQGNYKIDFQEFSIDQAGLFCLSPGQVLTVLTEKITTAYQLSFRSEFYCIETHGKEIACNGVLFNNVHRATFIPLSSTDVPIFDQLVLRMAQELEQPGRAHREMLEAYLRLFLIEALRKHDEKGPATIVETEESNRLISDFIALVDKHFRRIHAVSDYAELLHVSPKSLAKRLNAYDYGTPTELIRERIVLEAKRDLRYTQKSVKEIAFDLGFDDPAYFTRYFKKAEQRSPQAYRSAYLDSAA